LALTTRQHRGAPEPAGAHAGQNQLRNERSETLIRTTNTLLKTLAVGAVAVTVSACSTSTNPASPSSISPTASVSEAQPSWAAAAKPGPKTIVGIVTEDDGEFDVLQAAVIRAGLVDALNGTTQYTVFAPTDAAFVSTLGVANEAAAIAAVNGLPLDALTDILQFHVIEGRRTSRSVLAAPSYVTIGGRTLTRTQLAAAGFTSVDTSASNGIVHVINAVLIPAS
jgi:uncharacterized surface protein with fasciclin (FAS1) repeats